MKPVTEWRCFKQVADVIGHDNAVKELGKVPDLALSDDAHLRTLLDAFEMEGTHQGIDFWASINRGCVPEGYKLKAPKWQPKVGEVCLARCNGHFIPAEPLKKTELGNWVCLTTNEMTVFITDGVKPLPKKSREKFVEKAAKQFGYRADDLAALYDLAMEFK